MTVGSDKADEITLRYNVGSESWKSNLPPDQTGYFQVQMELVQRIFRRLRRQWF